VVWVECCSYEGDEDSRGEARRWTLEPHRNQQKLFWCHPSINYWRSIKLMIRPVVCISEGLLVVGEIPQLLICKRLVIGVRKNSRNNIPVMRPLAFKIIHACHMRTLWSVISIKLLMGMYICDDCCLFILLCS